MKWDKWIHKKYKYRGHTKASPFLSRVFVFFVFLLFLFLLLFLPVLRVLLVSLVLLLLPLLPLIVGFTVLGRRRVAALVLVLLQLLFLFCLNLHWNAILLRKRAWRWNLKIITTYFMSVILNIKLLIVVLWKTGWERVQDEKNSVWYSPVQILYDGSVFNCFQ